MSEDNLAGNGDSIEGSASAWFTTLIGVVVIVLGVVVTLVAYRIERHNYLSAGADNWGKVFIRSSPVIEQQLGSVRNVKSIEEKHVSGRRAGWYVDYDVTGRRGAGVVEMRLKPSEYAGWNVPLAELKEGRSRTINLR